MNMPICVLGSMQGRAGQGRAQVALCFGLHVSLPQRKPSCILLTRPPAPLSPPSPCSGVPPARPRGRQAAGREQQPAQAPAAQVRHRALATAQAAEPQEPQGSHLFRHQRQRRGPPGGRGGREGRRRWSWAPGECWSCHRWSTAGHRTGSQGWQHPGG